MEPFRFCPVCGGEVAYRVPEHDDKARAVCTACGGVQYENPHIVVGVVAFWQEKILLCKRAIAPRVGFWALPAGYLEMAETTEAGALREAWEEAGAELEIRHLLAIYNLAHLSQVQILYLADLKSPQVAAGPESIEVGLYAWDEIPWDELAFPSVKWALQHARHMRQAGQYEPDRRSTELEVSPDQLGF